MKRALLVFTLLLATVGCDQATKVLARDSLSYRSTSYLWDLLRLQHSENAGAFLSMGAGLENSTRFWIFTVGVSIFILGALWILIRKKDLDRWTTVSLTLLVGGGIGNLIDRVTKGTVTDFLNVGIGELRTGIFNVADMAIVAGVLILFVMSSKTPKTD